MLFSGIKKKQEWNISEYESAGGGWGGGVGFIGSLISAASPPPRARSARPTTAASGDKCRPWTPRRPPS